MDFLKCLIDEKSILASLVLEQSKKEDLKRKLTEQHREGRVINFEEQ